jgi:hypothetical protein
MMASRTGDKTAIHAARLVEQLRHTRRAPARRRAAGMATAIVLALAAAGAGVALAAGSEHHARGGRSARVDTGQLPGLRTTPAPWPAEYRSLPARLATLGLPPAGDENYHIHAHLAVFVNRKPVPVPANVGISAAARLVSPMHTHDTTGVIHIEAARPSDRFTLGAFFEVWGVELSATRLGGYLIGKDRTLTAQVNGKAVHDPTSYRLRPHDNIVLAYGSAATAPPAAPFTWPPGE